MSSRLVPKSHIIYTIAVIGFIYTLHLVIPMYSNSSFLSIFADEKTLSYIYMAGAAVSILGYLLAPLIIRRLGNYKTAILLIFVQIGLFYGLIASSDPLTITIIFVLQTAVIALISLCLDIFLEVYTEGSNVGSVRGLYAATLNASWIVAPLIGSMLINGTNNYHNTYVAALAMLFPLLYLVYRNFPKFKDPNYMHLSPHQLFKHVSTNQNWIRLFFANIVLQVFYSWMVVYCPIYLNKSIGFGWEDIGIILVIMLLPFPLIQYPLGKMSDGGYGGKVHGQKKIMMVGFVIMGLATIALSLFTAKNVALWALLLFMTRIGAAAVEIMIETYFFKTVSVRDSAALGIFRITRPLSYFIAPLITIIGLLFISNQFLFIIVGFICLVAIIPILGMKDTRG
jgi:MFS family permease